MKKRNGGKGEVKRRKLGKRGSRERGAKRRGSEIVVEAFGDESDMTYVVVVKKT